MSDIENPQNDQADSNEFAVRLTEAQSALYCYICSLLGSARDAHDVLQDTNLVLLSKADQYDFQKPFLPWANRIAFFQVLSHRKKAAIERLRFSDGVLDKIASETNLVVNAIDDRFVALEECIPKLSKAQRAIVLGHYFEGQSIKSIAASEDKSESAISSTLHRARQALVYCVEKALARGDVS